MTTVITPAGIGDKPRKEFDRSSITRRSRSTSEDPSYSISDEAMEDIQTTSDPSAEPPQVRSPPERNSSSEPIVNVNSGQTDTRTNHHSSPGEKMATDYSALAGRFDLATGQNSDPAISADTLTSVQTSKDVSPPKSSHVPTDSSWSNPFANDAADDMDMPGISPGQRKDGGALSGLTGTEDAGLSGSGDPVAGAASAYMNVPTPIDEPSVDKKEKPKQSLQSRRFANNKIPSVASQNKMTDAPTTNKRKRGQHQADVITDPEDSGPESKEAVGIDPDEYAEWEKVRANRAPRAPDVNAIRTNEVPASVQAEASNLRHRNPLTYLSSAAPYSGRPQPEEDVEKKLDEEHFGTMENEHEKDRLEQELAKLKADHAPISQQYEAGMKGGYFTDAQILGYEKKKREFEHRKRHLESSIREAENEARSQGKKKSAGEKEEKDTGDSEDDYYKDDEDESDFNPHLNVDESPEEKAEREKAERKAETIKKRNHTRKQESKRRSAFMEGMADYQTPEQQKRTRQIIAKLRREKKAQERAAKAKGSKVKESPDMLGNVDLSLFDDLLATDALADATAAQAKSAPQTTVKGVGARNKVLQQLINSIPEDARAEVAQDRSQIAEAVRKLGRGVRWDKMTGEGWRMKGVKATLRHHQILAVSCMNDLENSDNNAKGGMLADAMGFGKTIQMLALMVHQENIRRKEAADARKRREILPDMPRTTLIVAPVSLLTQWQREIEKWVEAGYFDGVQRHQGSTKFSTAEMMERADIVLTTYHEVCRSMPDFGKKPEAIIDKDEVREWWEKQWELRGPLHRARFLRIVLDESQAMTNHNCRTSIGCRSITADRHWAISGTPIQNGIDSFYSYMRYFKLASAAPTYGVFLEKYCNSQNEKSIRRLLGFLRTFMIRRTHKDMILGRSICNLPETHVETVYVDFNPVERAVYEIVRTRFLERIRVFKTEDKVERKYNNILVMLLRLRQMTAHMFLCEETIKELITLEDIDRIGRITDDEKQQRRTTGNAISATMNKEMADDLYQLRAAVRSQVERENGPGAKTDLFGGTSEDFDVMPYIKQMYLRNQEEIEKRSTCHRCGSFPEMAVAVKPCQHIYCLECFESAAAEAGMEGREKTMCLQCGEPYSGYRPVDRIQQTNADGDVVDHASSITIDDETGDETTQPVAKKQKKDGAQAQGKGKGKGKAKDNVSATPRLKKKGQTAPKLGTWMYFNKNVLNSPKLAAIGQKVSEVFKENSEEKIIIFTQMLGFIDVIRCYLEQLDRPNKGAAKKYEYIEYSGRLTADARSKNVDAFNEDSKIRIMIASLRCGGVGLNLTAASRVILVDLWWNASVEQQAFCRVFRIGQHRETYITRLIVKNTIDENLDKMQKRKQIGIDRALGNERREAKLTIEELIELFDDVETNSISKHHEAEMTRNEDYLKDQERKAERAEKKRSKEEKEMWESGNKQLPEGFKTYMNARTIKNLQEGGDMFDREIEDPMTDSDESSMSG